MIFHKLGKINFSDIIARLEKLLRAYSEQFFLNRPRIAHSYSNGWKTLVYRTWRSTKYLITDGENPYMMDPMPRFNNWHFILYLCRQVIVTIYLKLNVYTHSVIVYISLSKILHLKNFCPQNMRPTPLIYWRFNVFQLKMVTFPHSAPLNFNFNECLLCVNPAFIFLTIRSMTLNSSPLYN